MIGVPGSGERRWQVGLVFGALVYFISDGYFISDLLCNFRVSQVIGECRFGALRDILYVGNVGMVS